MEKSKIKQYIVSTAIFVTGLFSSSSAVAQEKNTDGAKDNIENTTTPNTSVAGIFDNLANTLTEKYTNAVSHIKNIIYKTTQNEPPSKIAKTTKDTQVKDINTQMIPAHKDIKTTKEVNFNEVNIINEINALNSIKTAEPIPPISIVPDTIASDSVHYVKWKNSKEGEEFIETFQNIMKNDGIEYKLNADDYIYLHKLSLTDRRIGLYTAALKEYKLSPEDFITMEAGPEGKKLAEASSVFRFSEKLTGNCHWSTKRTFTMAYPLGGMGGKYAYEAAKDLQINPNVVYVDIDVSNTDKLPLGTIVVHTKGNREAYAGHDYVIISGIADKKTYTNPETGKTFEYVPRQQSCDGIAKANITGIRNSQNPDVRYGPVCAGIIYDTKLSDATFLKMSYQYAKTRTSAMIVRPRDVYKNLLTEQAVSLGERAQKINYAKSIFANFNAKQKINNAKLDTIQFDSAKLSTKHPSSKTKISYKKTRYKKTGYHR